MDITPWTSAGTIPDQCHPFGVLYCCHCVSPTFTYTVLKVALRKEDLSSLETMQSAMIANH